MKEQIYCYHKDRTVIKIVCVYDYKCVDRNIVTSALSIFAKTSDRLKCYSFLKNALFLLVQTNN
jgi:hypothetical protein